MTVFLIGGTGFIGRAVTQRLADAGHTATVFHRGRTTPDLPDSVPIHHGDRGDPEALRDALDTAAPDVVLDVIPYTEAQAKALTSVCAGRTDRLVLLSSGDVYRQYDGLRGASDTPPDPVPLAEDAPLRTSRYPYRGADADFAYAHDYDKILVEEQGRAGTVPATLLRLPKVFGPGDSEHHVGSALARLREADGELVLSEREAQWRWSRGYVTNVADAIAAAVLDPGAGGRTYNVGEPDALPQATWLRRVAEAAGIDTAIRTGPRAEQPDTPSFNWAYRMALDTRRIRTELGFAEPISHPQALVQTVSWETE
ncbi:MAG: NAD-dependent epimerase/dehydratase family protein [Salinibacter sp.]|uniref:NAD-dependent epimerase/dehydratase family protein n=1 Tax=Salinibacter sp. TaxID=2065818 RepID=UPI0035D41DDA